MDITKWNILNINEGICLKSQLIPGGKLKKVSVRQKVSENAGV